MHIHTYIYIYIYIYIHIYTHNLSLCSIANGSMHAMACAWMDMGVYMKQQERIHSAYAKKKHIYTNILTPEKTTTRKHRNMLPIHTQTHTHTYIRAHTQEIHACTYLQGTATRHSAHFQNAIS